MARRADHDRDELHDMALEAAATIVAAEGFDALTARRIADAIGYSPGTLYNLFKGLDELILALNGRTLDGLRAELEPATRTGDPVADLKALLAAYLAYVQANARLWAVLFEHRLGHDRPLPDWYRATLAAALAPIERALSPFFGPEQPVEIAQNARVLWASLHGICELSMSGKIRAVTERGMAELAETLVVTYVAGLRCLHGRKS